MRQEQDELGRFKSQYSNLGDTVRMRVPKSCQKLIRELLTESHRMPRMAHRIFYGYYKGFSILTF